MTADETSDHRSARISFLVWHAHRVTFARVEEALRLLGLTPSQYGTLSNLIQFGELSSADLARASGLTPQSIATGLTRMLDNGWIERRPHPVHGRVALLDITASGRRQWAEADRRIDEIEREIRRALPGSRYGDLGRELAEVIAAFGATRPADARALWPTGPRSR